MTLSVIIPTLNSASHLRHAVADLRMADEVVVVDGGSTDGTPVIARDLGGKILRGERGRGTQLATGAGHAVGDWLLFLHADTRLAPGWDAEIRAFMANPANARRAAAFRFGLDSPAWQARALETLVGWRSRFGLPYGDQGLLIPRPLYDALGGYRRMPLMEDVDLVRRIGRRRLVLLKATAITSAERWERDGWLRRSARNLVCLALYFLGASPSAIRRLYG